MLRNKSIFACMCLIFFIVSSCIEEYSPEITDLDINKFVINGRVTNIEGFQSVFISKSSDMSRPVFIPVSNCDVKVIDDKGNIFQLIEVNKGEYNAYFDQKHLAEGTAFKVDIITPNGQLISSEFDTLHYCPEIDTIYYKKEDILTPDPDYKIQGIQFYVDYNGIGSESRHIKWEIEETWEYHARYPYKWYWDGAIHEIYPPDYSKNVCWANNFVQGLYIVSTNNLTENRYEMFPLHYIDNTTQRLAYSYSLNLIQCALSKEAFTYYKTLKTNILTDRGLYNTQPIPNEGNLTNITDPDQIVLGFFYAAGQQSKRIFVYPIENLKLEFNYLCTYRDLTKVGFRGIYYPFYPAALWLDGAFYWILEDCYDCTCEGGTLDKPDFWPIDSKIEY